MRHAGFTLLELLIVMLVLSILVSVSLPDFSQMIEARRSDLTIRRLAHAVETARISAITQDRKSVV